MKAIDLFSGAGGTTLGAIQAGCNVVWAANHKPSAVKTHKANHPDVIHVTQDLCQADWSEVPEHDLLLASPCCQGHSRAAGKAKRSRKADISRNTAWAVTSALDILRPKVAIIENVTDLLKWELASVWFSAFSTLGYSYSVNKINAADVGVPQLRERIFIVLTKGSIPLSLYPTKKPRIAARTFIDTDTSRNKWNTVASRCENTRQRIERGRKRFGDVFLDAAYTSERGIEEY